MVIERLRQRAREAAEADAHKEADSFAQEAKESARDNKRKSKNKRPFALKTLASHPVFVPALTIWFAALIGLSVLMIVGLTQFLYAGVAAAIGGAIGFALSKTLALKTRQSHGNDSIAAMTARRVRPIDPASELGSESLDAPIETMPFSLDERYELGDEPAAPDTAEPDADRFEETPKEEFTPANADAAWHEAAVAEDELDAPLELTLEEFGETPGRNGVWIEEPAPETAPLHAVDSAVAEPANEDEGDDSATTALEKLREVPPEDLSLVQMVERFAAALHEHQEMARSTPRHAAGYPPRDAALAEALKALSLFTERGFDKAGSIDDLQDHAEIVSETERELRDALNKLQTLRGAA
ncbi:MAG: hypothetical protein SXU28_02565 [Pseudomonadota bacterium]|nr:hypothetical protein [Pseudomonadota bacterium]